MRILFRVLLATPFCLPVFAENSPAPIDTIIVEATKRPMRTSNMPSQVSLIDSERVEREVAQTIADLVRYEPGVDVQDQGSRFGLSGISIRGVGGNRVHIEVDGVAAPEGFTVGSFSNASRDFFDIASLKQVEIIRGPASALFGSDALGGVVSFVTKGPGDLLSGNNRYMDLSAGYNSVDSSEVLSGTFATKIGNAAAMFRITRREGNERDIDAADPMRDRSLNLLAKLDYGDIEAGGLTLALEHFTSTSGTDVNSSEGIQDFSASFGFPYVIDTAQLDADDSRRRVRFSIGQEWRSGGVGVDYLRWRAYHQRSKTLQDTFEQRTTLIAGARTALELERDFAFEQALNGIEINAGSDFAIGAVNNELAYGIEFESTDTDQIRRGRQVDLQTGETGTRIGPDDYPVRDFPLSTTTRRGVYLQNTMTLGNWTLTPGLRWDRFEIDPVNDAIFAADNPGITPEAIRDERVSPKIGASVILGDWQLYTQYAEGFRAPPVNDVNVGFTNFQFGYTALPNPDLRAETSRGYELGGRFSSAQSEWDLAVFRTRYQDFIQSLQVVGFDPVNQVVQFQSVNLDNVTIEGAELRAVWQPARAPSALRLHLSAAYARGRDDTSGQPINSIAPLNGVFGVDYLPEHNRWGVNVIARAAARQQQLDQSNGEILSPAGYVVYDMTGFWKPTRDTRVRAGLYNLGDVDYTPYLDVQGLPANSADAARFVRPGRQASIAIDWQF